MRKHGETVSVSSTNDSTNDYLDLDDLIEELDSQKRQKQTSNSGQPVTYNSLLNTISEIGKMADKTDKIFPGKEISQDLTASLFANMSDSEMMSHFLPMRGIDYDQAGDNTSNFLEKMEKKEKDKKEEETAGMLYADELMPHRMMPHLNPLYHMSAFKSTFENNAIQGQRRFEEIDNEVVSEINFEEEAEEDEYDDDDEIEIDQVESQVEIKKSKKNEKTVQLPREIKKRKPRTYKYNPKPLQHKINRSFVPDTAKDLEYWARRKRNNEAAKKSREERRKKELEILKSYEIMKQEYSQIKIENIRLMARNSMLEKQYAELKCKLK